MRKRMIIALAAALALSLSACGAKEIAEDKSGQSESVDATETTETSEVPATTPAQEIAIDGEIQMGQVITAAHGNKCFTQVTAVVYGDVVIAAYIDEYQFGAADSMKAVPNGDDAENFGAGFAEGQVLFSKRENAEAYSKQMAEKAGSVVRYNVNLDEIQKFAIGKTIAELKGYQGDSGAVDAVTGATLMDTGNYLAAIGEAAEAATKTPGVAYSGSSEELTLKMVLGAAHGNKCFSTAAVLTDGTNIVLSWIDDFQFGDANSGMTGVPNSEDVDNFGAGYAEGKILFSKRVNAEYYSKQMADKAGSTVRFDENLSAIQNHVSGMSIADAAVLAGQGAAAVDTVTGATLMDTAGYVGLIVDATK